MKRQRGERRGRIAEWAAMLYLMCKGYRLRTPHGEVDLAAWKELVMVEVKARDTFDAGAYAVTPVAQQRIARAAQALAGRSRLQAAPVRFDLVVVGSGLLPRHQRAAWFDERRRLILRAPKLPAGTITAPCVLLQSFSCLRPPQPSAAA